MLTAFKKSFLAEPMLHGAGVRYGLLACIIGLIIGQAIAEYISPSQRLGGLFGFIAPLALLFNHLAYQFRWPRAAMISLRVLAWVWIIVGTPYILFVAFA
jgi:hypothetical protein